MPAKQRSSNDERQLLMQERKTNMRMPEKTVAKEEEQQPLQRTLTVATRFIPRHRSTSQPPVAKELQRPWRPAMHINTIDLTYIKPSAQTRALLTTRDTKSFAQTKTRLPQTEEQREKSKRLLPPTHYSHSLSSPSMTGKAAAPTRLSNDTAPSSLLMKEDIALPSNTVSANSEKANADLRRIAELLRKLPKREVNASSRKPTHPMREVILTLKDEPEIPPALKEQAPPLNTTRFDTRSLSENNHVRIRTSTIGRRSTIYCDNQACRTT